MVTTEIQTNTEAQALTGARSSETALDALALLKEAGNLLSNPTREIAGAGLAYLLNTQLVLVNDFNIPSEASSVLNDLGATSVRADGRTLRMTLRDAKYKTFEGGPPMWFDKNVSAEVRRTDSRIEINNIKGVMVDPGRSLPFVYVKSAVLEMRDGKCIAQVKGGRIGLNKTQTIEMPAEVFDQVNATLKANGL